MKCDICGTEHSAGVNFQITGLSDESYEICSMCFLSTIPSYSIFNQFDSSMIESDKPYNRNVALFNTFLYNKIKKSYNGSNNKCLNTNKDNEISTKKKDNSNDYLTNMSLMPEESFFGREKEISQIMDILSRKTKRNPIIVGPAGCGKTALVKKIAHILSTKAAPECLRNKVIYSTDIMAMLSGSKYRGDFEAKIEKVINSIIQKEDSILFIDEIHTINIGGNEENSGSSAGDVLKPYLSDDNLQVIGATTLEDYRQKIECNPALNRRFQPVFIEEPSEKEVVDMLKAIKPSFQAFHRISISDDMLKECVSLANKYIKYRNNPDKSIDLLDMACVLAKKRTDPNDKSIEKPDKVFENAYNTCKNRYFESYANLELIDILYNQDIHDKYAKMMADLKDELSKFDFDSIDSDGVTRDDFISVIESWTKIPVSNMSQSYKQQYNEIDTQIKCEVIGQNHAIDKVVSTVIRRKLAISDTNRPASFIFVGETGVGKTELSKSLARHLFGGEDKLIRFDMSEYMEPHTVSKLIGAPPGYVGYNQPGLLTEALKRHPFSVILFDEIEKAHPDIANILLQLLDDGRITDSKGTMVDASNAIIILTSNAGSNLAKGVGFGMDTQQASDAAFKKGLESTFRPEFLGRVDEIINFHTLSDENYQEIAKIYINKLVTNLSKSNVTLTYDESLPEFICNKANTGKYHAREIKRTVTRCLEDKILETFLENDDISILHVAVDDDCSNISIKIPELAFEN